MKSYVSSLLSLALIASASPVTAATLPFSNLIVFGDSLVDAGNAQIESARFGLPNPAPTGAGYFAGRFSNGPTFADYLNADIAGNPAAFTVASKSVGGGNNFGFGGADLAFSPTENRESFLTQLNNFATSGQSIGQNTLVLVTFGGNDVRDLVGVDGDFDFADALDDLRTGLLGLTGRGARNIVITGLPDIGKLPDTIGDAAGDQDVIDDATERSDFLNDEIEDVVTALRTETGQNLVFFNLFDLNNDLVTNPAAFGFPGLNTTATCQSGGPTAVVVNGCRGYLYFDPVHPTTQIHRLIADEIGEDLLAAAVPEPATWAMMLAGFGLVGGMARRRRAGLALTA